MNILGWVLFGFIVGLIARAVAPGQERLSFMGTVLLGVVGALLAGWAGQVFGLYGPDEGAGFFVATLGAIIVLTTYNFVQRASLRQRIKAVQPTADTPIRLRNGPSRRKRAA
jgi:uncharacterized membrane protein YeaQ/YmgE (transglycosylase-associated protein family)